MRKAIFTIIENTSIAEGVWRLTLAGDTSDITAPGQFVNIELDGFYLRRPLSVCNWRTVC
jgi:dihydroorotate dehydrogenase electron transfer subunit